MQKVIYAHEHIIIDLSGPKNDDDCRLDDRDLTQNGLYKLKDSSVNIIIDQTAIGMGRDVLYAKELTDNAGIELCHATGFYKEPFLPDQCYKMNEQEMTKLFCKELEVGIDETGILASHIGEIGTGKDSISEVERKIFSAASRAHNQTGAPICTHTTLGTLGIEQLELFKQYNVNLEKVVLSHIDLSGDIEYMIKLLDFGVNIAFDTIGKNNYQLDADRIKWLNELCNRGYQKQIVASMDLTRKSNCKELGYDYLVKRFIPNLKITGFKDAWINDILWDNPYRIYINN